MKTLLIAFIACRILQNNFPIVALTNLERAELLDTEWSEVYGKFWDVEYEADHRGIE